MATAYRIANYDTPFWISPNRSPGRFNREGGWEGTQYLTLHPLGCVAEYLRGHDIVNGEDVHELFVRVWVAEIDLTEAGSLTFDNADQHGLSAAGLIDDDYRACQDWADRVRRDPTLPRSWVVPSAALPGTENLVIFGGRVLSPFHRPPIDGDVDLPATIVGDVSLLPAVVIPQTRFRGDNHPGFDAWARGIAYEYQEPNFYPLPE